MNNFNEMPYGKELLLAMYNTPRSEFSTQQIVELLQTKLKCPTITETHVSKIYLDRGLKLVNRLKVPAKPPKPIKVDVMELLRSQLITQEQPIENPTLFPIPEEDDDYSTPDEIELAEFEQQEEFYKRESNLFQV